MYQCKAADILSPPSGPETTDLGASAGPGPRPNGTALVRRPLEEEIPPWKVPKAGATLGPLESASPPPWAKGGSSRTKSTAGAAPRAAPAIKAAASGGRGQSSSGPETAPEDPVERVDPGQSDIPGRAHGMSDVEIWKDWGRRRGKNVRYRVSEITAEGKEKTIGIYADQDDATRASAALPRLRGSVAADPGSAAVDSRLRPKQRQSSRPPKGAGVKDRSFRQGAPILPSGRARSR